MDLQRYWMGEAVQLDAPTGGRPCTTSPPLVRTGRTGQEDLYLLRYAAKLSCPRWPPAAAFPHGSACHSHTHGKGAPQLTHVYTC